jgi:hypothetical protein
MMLEHHTVGMTFVGSESLMRICEGGLTLVFWMYRNLMILRVAIQVAKRLVSQPL